MGICAGAVIRTESTSRCRMKSVTHIVLEIMRRNVEDSGGVQYSPLVSWSFTVHL